MVFVHDQKMSLESLLQQATAQKTISETQGLLPFAIHTQAWSKRVVGQFSNWNEPLDPAASLADPTLWQ
jgi:hypothetical protein